jgi:tetratricopeptide (TPR) repeat protein
MRTIALFALIVGAQVSPARATGSIRPSVSEEPAPIEELVRLYRSGLHERAVVGTAGWNAERIGLEVDRLVAEEASRRKAAEREVRVLPSLDVVGLEREGSHEAAEQGEVRLTAAAILTERALSRLREADQELLAPSLWAASRLVDVKPLGESGRAFARCFYLLAGLILHLHVEIAEGHRLLARALEDYPDDPELHAALGSTIEAVASLRQYELPPGSPEAATRSSGGYVAESGAFGGRLPKASLVGALAHYERALALDPGLDEARLRLAHVRLVSGRAGQALTDLERVATEARQPRQRYLARLFAGFARERLGDLDGAANEYRACVAEGPRAQTALLALGRSLERLGDKAGAQEAFEGASARGAPFDPWWSYQAGQPERLDDLVARLRGLVQ